MREREGIPNPMVCFLAFLHENHIIKVQVCDLRSASSDCVASVDRIQAFLPHPCSQLIFYPRHVRK